MSLFHKKPSKGSKCSRWTLHGLEVEFNALLVKIKLIFGKKEVPQELSSEKRKELERAVSEEIARLEARANPPVQFSLPRELPVVAPRMALPAAKTSRGKPRSRKRPMAVGRPKSPRSRAMKGEIVTYVPVASGPTGLAVPQPTNLMAETVRQLAGHYRQKAIKKGDIPTALAAAWVEQEATKAAYAEPQPEHSHW